VAALEHAITEIVERHESLRSVFAEVDGAPVQRITAPQPVRLVVEDLSALSPDERREAIRARVQHERDLPFDLRRGPLYRAVLLRTAPAEHLFVFLVDHITFDAVSILVFLQELRALYEAFVAGRPSPLAPLSIQVADVAIWQRKRFTEPVLASLRAYWIDALQSAKREIALPADRPRGEVNTVESITVVLDPRRSEALRRASAAHGGLFPTMWTALMATLYETSGEDDLVVGMFHANRSQASTHALIGSFANMLAVRTRITATETLGELRARLRSELLDTYEQVDLPLPKVMEAVKPPRVPGRHPLFNVAFQLIEGAPGLEAPPVQENGARISMAPLTFSYSQQVDIFIKASAVGAETAINFAYKRHFDERTIQALTRRYVELIELIVDDPSSLLPPPVRKTLSDD